MNSLRALVGYLFIIAFGIQSAGAQHSTDPPAVQLSTNAPRGLLLRDFRPQSTLKVKQTLLTTAKFPVVDIHTHFRIRLHHAHEQLEQFVSVMDRNQIKLCVSLDGQLDDAFEEHAAYLWKAYPTRFVIFANIDWQGNGQADRPETWSCQQPEFARVTIEQLRRARELGASGVKVFKDFGLKYRNPDGSFIALDDARFSPIWDACGELGLPVLIHAADPPAFFDKIDARNERFEELDRHPEWSYPGDTFPSYESVLSALDRLLAAHRKTTFIGAHLASRAEDLETAADWLARHPNLYMELASRISELGRQPYTARRFLIDHADRILFGTDGPWPESRLHLYWRFLETFDEYFPYSEKEFPPQGFWNIYGVGLPDEVLKKIYNENARRIIPGVAAKLDAQSTNTDTIR